MVPKIEKKKQIEPRPDSAFLFSRHPSHDFGVVNNYILWWTKNEKLQLCGDFSQKNVTCFWRKDDNSMAQWGPGFDHLVLGLLPSSLPQNERQHDSALMIQIDSIDQTLGSPNHQKTCVYIYINNIYILLHYIYIYILYYIIYIYITLHNIII